VKLSTLMFLGAATVAATATTVWLTIDPARGSGGTTTTHREPGPTKPVVVADPPVEPVVDRSHFTAGKTLMAEGRLGHAVLPAGSDSETFVFVDVSADAARTAARAAPLNLAIVVDRSGSMKGKRLDNALAATRTAIGRLRDGDVVSVISYNTGVEVVVSPTVIDAASRDQVTRAVARIRPGGDTCISCGVDAGMRLLGQRPGMVNQILLLSDGLATAGVRDLPGFARIAEDCRRMGASVTTIGVDVDYDERILAALARDSNGRHFFVENPGGLPTIFDQEMAALTRTVANHTELAIDLAPGVFVEHVYDRASSGRGSQVVIPLGTFTAGEHKTALVRVRVPHGAPGERPIAAVRLRYDDLVEARPGQCEGQLVAVATTDPARLSPLDGFVSARVSSSETAEALEEANELFRNGRNAEAQGLIREKARRVRHWRDEVNQMDPFAGAKVDGDFARQAAALDHAGRGFEPAKPGAAAPKPTDRPAASQLKSNQADALELAR